MSYRSMVELSTSPSLLDRIAACFAQFHVPNPRAVADENIWRLAATPGWADAWAFAVDNYNINQNPDTGARSDVISDDMILTAVADIAQPTAESPAGVARAAGRGDVTDEPQVVEPGVVPE